MINIKDILDKATKLGSNMGGIMQGADDSEALLNSILSNRDEIPKEMLGPLDKSLAEIRKSKADVKQQIKNMEETFNRNGNNSNR